MFSNVGQLSEIQTFPVQGQSFEAFTIDGSPHLVLARMDDGNGDTCTDGIVYQWDSMYMNYMETG